MSCRLTTWKQDFTNSGQSTQFADQDITTVMVMRFMFVVVSVRMRAISKANPKLFIIMPLAFSFLAMTSKLYVSLGLESQIHPFEADLISDVRISQYSPEEQERIRTGFTRAVEIVGVITESAAVIGFLTLEGKMDYHAFSIAARNGQQWCK